MTTLRQAAWKFVPPGQALSARALADQLGTGPSVRRLLRQLTPESRLISSGGLGPSTVSGFFELVLLSDGFWSFKGHVHESGLVGHDYAAATVLTYVDPDGHVYAFPTEGTVHGTSGIGSRDSDWQHDGWDRRISQHWDEVLSSGWKAELDVSTNVWDLVEGIAAGIAVGAVGVLFASGSTSCEWATFPHDDGTTGVGVTCRRSPQE